MRGVVLLLALHLGIAGKHPCPNHEYVEKQSNCWTKGSWKWSPAHPELLEENYGHDHHQCRKSMPDEDYKVALQWYWKPDDKSCPLIVPTRKDFCDALNGRNILVVGDSLNEEVFATIASLTTNSWTGGHQLDQEPKPSFICNNTIKMMYIRNDYLSALQLKDFHMCPYGDATCLTHGSLNYIEIPWLHHATSGEFQIVILNRGAHYVDDDTLHRQLHALVRVLKKSNLSEKGIQMFYRTTVSGHPNCAQYMKPSLVPISAQGSPSEYHWEDFARQNEIAFSYFEYIDAFKVDANATATYRGDLHTGAHDGDCLHYCIPGPVDTWVIFLYNLIMLCNEQ